MKSTPVLAAIPNYNHGEALAELLPEILEQEYDGVVVCDDASSDESRDTVRAFGKDVEFVAGSENVGAGANRNRVLQSATLEKVGGTALIHFLDADTKLVSDRNPERIHEIMSPSDIGAAGGLVRDEHGAQVALNYGKLLGGPKRFFGAYATSATLLATEVVRQKSDTRAQQLREKLSPILRDYPDVFAEPAARDIGWMIEANMVVHSEIFQKIGGFDPKLRFHEIQELALQLEKLGLRRRFDPSVEVVQQAIDVRGSARNIEHLRAATRLLLRYTLHTQPRYNREHGQEKTASS